MTITYLKRPVKALTLIGLWFPPEKHRLLYLIYRNILLASQYSFLLFNIIYVGTAWGDLEEVSEASYLLFTQFTMCLMVTFYLVNRNKMIRLLEFMESDVFLTKSEVHERILSKQSLKMWRIYTFYMASGMTNCTEWALLPLFDNQSERTFPFKIWMPLDPARSPEFEIGCVYQGLCIYISATIFLTIDFITISMIMFASAQLDIIVQKIQTIRRDDRRYVERENIFKMSATVAIICIIGFRITVESPNSLQFYSTLNYLATMLAQVYLYCWCGNDLTDKSQVLRDTLYNGSWYEQDYKFKKTLCIAMECMKRPIIFRAGYYIPLSRPTFVSILRCSYSYFAVLNQANNK